MPKFDPPKHAYKLDGVKVDVSTYVYTYYLVHINLVHLYLLTNLNNFVVLYTMGHHDCSSQLHVVDVIL